MRKLLVTMHRQPVWIALLIFVALCVWVASGSLVNTAPEAPPRKAAEQSIASVRVTRLQAESVAREVVLYGRTEPNRETTLRAEIEGTVVALHVVEGQRVSAGQRLVSLDPKALQQQIAAATSQLKQREIELQGAQSLGQKGYQSEVNLAQARASLAQAQANLAALKISLAHTEILAPYDGVLNRRWVEKGDLLRVGDSIADIVDLDPLVVRADVTERHIAALTEGMPAVGRVTGALPFEGTVQYISSVSNQGTNTFPIEVWVDNPGSKRLAGMSTELTIPLQATPAIRVTPAVMALDEQGNLGVKTVVNNTVQFVPIDMVKSDADAVWLAGLGEQADIITLGQGFVKHGDPVRVERQEPLGAN
ncbi:efflux RND transporter periplasmic adaptor subunit [Aestuariibacter halophilus]|uniref:Efflux RND transporter periplasmic adaptor subunit n=1 Tax=Fluctibacter halophilus TaxID=226011 RepID=A0ABS8GA40_9ALTE|nr:efflux RND transporter periplasmic adaptor subunit [Aestuariibacter halophilus]MCC2617455.1 efflux RND transporter periplasmic adaptor subunit [Aestuariibacter halophilus]